MENMPNSLPFSQIAEDSVISAMMQSNDAVSRATTMGVREMDFHDPANAEIFGAIIDLFNFDLPADIASLQAQLEKRGTLDQIGGLTRLVELYNFAPTTANLAHHARIVMDKSARRRIIKASEEINTAAYSAEDETTDVLDFAEQKIFEIAEGRTGGDFVRLPDVISARLSQLEALQKGAPADEEAIDIECFSELNRILSGLHKANLILVAARPAMGKTSFAMNIAHHVAHKKKIPVAVFSLEMSKEELANRIWSSETHVDVSKIQDGDFQEDEWQQLIRSIKVIAEEPLYIDDSGSPTVTEMRAKCRRLKREHGLGLVIIDHIQLMQGSRRSSSRQEEVSEISRSLKLMAKDLNVPIIVLSQLNRNPEGRAGNKPALSDLRESGAIEQDADVVMMLYREGYYKPEEVNVNLAECIIAKHRNGRTGTVKLGWHPEWTKFETWEERYEEN